MTELEELFDERGGIAGVRDLATFFDVSESVIRDWAHQNEIPKAGNAFAFCIEDGQALADDLEPDEDEEDEVGDAEDDGDDEEDDEEDTEEDE